MHVYVIVFFFQIWNWTKRVIRSCLYSPVGRVLLHHWSVHLPGSNLFCSGVTAGAAFLTQELPAGLVLGPEKAGACTRKPFCRAQVLYLAAHGQRHEVIVLNDSKPIGILRIRRSLQVFLDMASSMPKGNVTNEITDPDILS